MANEKMEWVEIIEPKTKERMYANLTTGVCVWDPPVGVPVKKTDNKQWWELFDPNTGRFYYYNATTQKTVWHRPQNCDIIPLAKLQTLKQNTEPKHSDDNNDLTNSSGQLFFSIHDGGGSSSEKTTPKFKKLTTPTESVATQTPVRSSSKSVPGNIKLSTSSTSTNKLVNDECPSSPRSAKHHHHHHHRHGENCKSSDCRSGRRGSQGSYNRQTAQSQESGRSSDSSSAISVTRQQQSINSIENNRYNVPPTELTNAGNKLAPSPSTPLLKKRSPSAKANSFDTNISIGGGYSLSQDNRTSSRQQQRMLSGSLSNHGIARSQSFAQRSQQQTSVGVGSQTEQAEDDLNNGDNRWLSISSSGRRSADSPIDRESIGKNSALSKLSPEYANTGRSVSPLQRFLGTDTNANNPKHNREPSSSDMEELNGAWGGFSSFACRKHYPDSNSDSSSRRVNTGLTAESLKGLESSWGSAASQHLPLYHYMLEQAQLECYKFGQRLEEEDSPVNSDDEKRKASRPTDYSSDEFADDEAVSNPEDSNSSQEEFHNDMEEDEDDPRYMNTTAATYSDHHYSDAADYMDASCSDQLGAALYYNTRLSQHTVRPLSGTSQQSHENNLPGGTPVPLPHVPYETQHTSLRRSKEPQITPQQPLYSPVLERSDHLLRIFTPCDASAHSLPNSPSPLCNLFMSSTAQYEHLSRLVLNRERKLPSESDIEKYAQDNLNIHKKGIFRKKFSVRELLSWSKDPIRKPMLVLNDKVLKKDATDAFKLLQAYMGDRKLKQGQSRDSVILEILTLAHSKPSLRDELYVQICRQTTENPIKESLRLGWELMAVCLYFFPPSSKFQAYLESYMNRHRDPSYESFPEVGKWPIHVQISHYAAVSCKRLQRIGVGGKRQIKKPTLEEIEQAKLQIFRPSMFGSTLEEVMALQKSRFPHHKLPWVQTTLSDEVLRLQGTHTEGIFRVSADVDEVTSLKQQLDRWDRPAEYTDAHTPASLLKLWYRELYEPLIPDNLYEDCIQCHDDAAQAAAIVDNLPTINKMVLAYLIRFLQIFARPEIVAVTKMDASNLAMVMAPNCLRCCCSEPRVMYENARKEMAFIRTLILHFDTDFMQGIL